MATSRQPAEQDYIVARLPRVIKEALARQAVENCLDAGSANDVLVQFDIDLAPRHFRLVNCAPSEWRKGIVSSLPRSSGQSLAFHIGPAHIGRKQEMTDSPVLTQPKQLKFRTIWISDLHLGTRRAQAETLLDFLRLTESQTLFLVGDIIDNWSLKQSWYWEQSHNDVIQKLLRKARKGTRVVFIPGNHDEYFRDLAGHRFGQMSIVEEAIHVTATGRRYLVLHGDKFDGVILYAKWLARLGDRAYELAVDINTLMNRARRRLGLPYWSLSALLKRRVKRAVEFLSHFEDAIVREAQRHGADGVICGHVHTPQMRQIGAIHYCNDGDWVESCTALVEHFDGSLEILDWPAVQSSMGLSAPLAAALAGTAGALGGIAGLASRSDQA